MEDHEALRQALEWSSMEAAQRGIMVQRSDSDEDLQRAIEASLMPSKKSVLVYCHHQPPVHSPPLNEHGLVDVPPELRNEWTMNGLPWSPHWWKSTMEAHFDGLMEADVHYVDPLIRPVYENDPLAHKRDGFSQEFVNEFRGKFDCVFMPDCGGPFAGPDSTEIIKSTVDALVRCMALLKPGGKIVASKFIDTVGYVAPELRDHYIVVQESKDPLTKSPVLTLHRVQEGGRRAWKSFGAQAALLVFTVACSFAHAFKP